MAECTVNIDGKDVLVRAGTTILEAAGAADVYVPCLCSHPDLPPAEGCAPAQVIYQGERRIENAFGNRKRHGCGLCVVEVEGEPELVRACSTEVRHGMVVATGADRVRAARQENLISILSRHPHACLTCAQREGCSRSRCSSNVPEAERCCTLFGHCELQRVSNYVGISPSTPRWVPSDQPVLRDAPLFVRDYNLCIGCTRCVRACRDLRGIEALGFVFDERGAVQVGSVAPTLEASGCKFCTACVEVCPTGALTDTAVRPGRKEEDLVPCREACPVHMDVPGYLRLVAEGRRAEAHGVIREKVPFPGVLGRVCTHPCEEVCRRGQVNEPVAICALKRYAADGGDERWRDGIPMAPETGKRVAVVGAGPSGLTAAFYLRNAGHGVTVFDSLDSPGGMVRYGIPKYRLPEAVLDGEIQDILDRGVEFRPGVTMGEDISLSSLRQEGYDAVFIAVGARLSRRISIEGADAPDVLWGVDVLRDVAGGRDVEIKEKVIVIGGGSVAVDVAMTAQRCGAERVSMACLESREEVPAHRGEIERALEEGVVVLPSWGPRRIVMEKGEVTGVELVRCTSVFDAEGNFRPSFGNGTCIIEGRQVIMAIGQASDLSFLAEEPRIVVEDGLVKVDVSTLETGLRGVYAGGDATQMGGSVVHAVAAGRTAASAIDRALGGAGVFDEVLFERPHVRHYLGRDELFAARERLPVPKRDPAAGCRGFEEIVHGYSDEQAVEEAGRCLQCDLRLALGCNPFPPQALVRFGEAHILGIPEGEGVYHLYDEDLTTVAIKGTVHLRKSLLEELEGATAVAWFDFEEDKMYSKRESELIQQYLHKHGRMPGGDSDLDDLF